MSASVFVGFHARRVASCVVFMTLVALAIITRSEIVLVVGLVLLACWLVRLARRDWSQFVFYAGFFGMILAETYAWSITGLVLGVLVFVVGGSLWGYWHIRHTAEGTELYGGILPFTDRMLRKRPKLWLLPSALLVGGPGVGLVMKKQGHSQALRFTITASAMYAAIWVTIHALRPPAGVPVHAWPSTESLQNIWNTIPVGLHIPTIVLTVVVSVVVAAKYRSNKPLVKEGTT